MCVSPTSLSQQYRQISSPFSTTKGLPEFRSRDSTTAILISLFLSVFHGGTWLRLRRPREGSVRSRSRRRAVASGLRNEEAQRDAEGRRRADSEAKAKEVLARDNAETIQPIDRAAQPSTENSGSIQSSRSTPSFSGLISFIGKILGIIALVCIVAGLCWAIANWKLLKDIYDIFEVLRKLFFG